MSIWLKLYSTFNVSINLKIMFELKNLISNMIYSLNLYAIICKNFFVTAVWQYLQLLFLDRTIIN